MIKNFMRNRRLETMYICSLVMYAETSYSRYHAVLKNTKEELKCLGYSKSQIKKLDNSAAEIMLVAKRKEVEKVFDN